MKAHDQLRDDLLRRTCDERFGVEPAMLGMRERQAVGDVVDDTLATVADHVERLPKVESMSEADPEGTMVVYLDDVLTLLGR